MYNVHMQFKSYKSNDDDKWKTAHSFLISLATQFVFGLLNMKTIMLNILIEMYLVMYYKLIVCYLMEYV